MAPNTLTRRLSAALGGAAILAMIGFAAACSTDSDTPEQAPTTTEPTLTPTEKSINSGEEDFTPPVKAPQQTVRAPNAPVFRD
ncbi:hypothetical protein MCHIJ_30030 [Mycolicibacterium chitae]|uniref:Uncharacterized protein n=1 Tax=Mycolicibacterium chitae TaxID=1792 RepID=A0A3S4RRS7_MYCCI|nr:hypothetical protein [Mycolicibacterium chitae]MCV7109307.1 hypothetical protein [Mycolicibacterium chitae]BBZ03566.1 hypothetical protein MCHIJ_30030 [Mycolicibacterium chitae]VEG47223.1 Uncharacterised protein [Mycolicibacterium chitae]